MNDLELACFETQLIRSVAKSIITQLLSNVCALVPIFTQLSLVELLKFKKKENMKPVSILYKLQFLAKCMIIKLTVLL